MIRTWSETGSLRHRLGYAWRPKLPGIWAAYALLLLLSTQAGACSLFGEGRRTAPAVVLEEGPDREGPVEASPETSTSDASTDSMDASNSDGPGPMGNPLDRVLTDPPVLAWMLPFSLDKRSLDALRNPSDQKRNRPMVGLGFWEGALLAADTLEALGISVDLMAFDTKNSVAEVRSLCRKPELQQADLLLGPMFKGPMQEAMQFAREQGIPIVSPYLRHNSEELGHGQYGLRPDNGHLLEALGSYLAEERRRDRIIVLRRDSAEEVRLTQHLLFGMPDSASRSRVIEWRSDFRLEGLEDTLSLVEHNAIVVPSRDEVFVNAVCRALATLSASSEHRISVYGLSDWRRFESIALDYLNRIDWHFPVHYWPEVDSAFAEGFDAQFRRRFKGPPSPFSYLGYDLTLYWGQRLHREALAEGRDAGSAPVKDPDRPLRWPDLPSSYEGMLDAFSFEAVAKGRAPGEYLGTDTTSPGTTKADREANSSDHVDPYQSPLEHAWLNRHWHLIRYRNWSFAPIKSGH